MLRLSTLLLASLFFAQAQRLGIGKDANSAEAEKMNLTVYPSGKGLPKGSGTALKGQSIYKEKCSECHNEKGEGREAQYPALVGGIGTLGTAKPLKTVGSYWPYATTVFDYIRRAMPFDHPRTLSADEVYSLTAFILHRNGIVTETQELDEKNLAGVKMPNRDGFILYAGPRVKSKR